MSKKNIALTQTVQKGGCAAKIAADELRRMLSKVKFPLPHPELLVDGRFFDDAAIYRISEEIALVQTLDFFTPIVDTPRLFGAVAASNALSDVYAMGGRPKTAMGILAFPVAMMSTDIIVEILQGASDKIAEAKANFVGGHSIDDDTLKFGLSVTGFVHPNRVWSNSRAKVGDHLILTKAIGTGAVAAGLKRKELKESDIAEVLQSMMQINNVIDLLSDSQIAEIHAATDITGFGLSGHSTQLAKASNVTLKIQVKELPVFSQSIFCLEKNFLTKAHRSNADYTAETSLYVGLSSIEQLLIHDPQTSGGLLLAVSPSYSESILKSIQQSFSDAKIIGCVVDKQEHFVIYES